MQIFTTVSIAASAFFAIASAQQQYQIDPLSVNITIRESWCNSETTQCPLICAQIAPSATTLANDCDATSLRYHCVCENGQSPNLTEYTQTLPFFVCQTWGQQCVSNCNGDNSCAATCLQQHPCGAQSPIRANTSTLTSTTSAASSSSATGGAASVTDGQTIYSGFAGASASQTSGAASAASSTTTASSAGRIAAMQFGQTAGFFALASAFFGGFAFLL